MVRGEGVCETGGEGDGEREGKGEGEGEGEGGGVWGGRGWWCVVRERMVVGVEDDSRSSKKMKITKKIKELK